MTHNGVRLRAGQYLRVSVDKSGRARSIDEQQVDNERDADAQRWDIVKTYRDPERSASRYARRVREDYQVLLADIEKREIDVLILWEPSRGSRKVSEWVQLIELAEAHHVVFSVTSHGRVYDPVNPRDRRSLLEDAVDSEYESGKVSVRVKRTVAAAAVEGRPHGKVPYGYLRDYDPHTGALIRQVPDPDSAPILREIVSRVLAGDGLRAIAADLTRREIPTPEGHRALRLGAAEVNTEWTPSKLRTLLVSPTMTGMRVHQAETVGLADWDPVVSPADWAALQVALKDPARRTSPGSRPKHLLSGIAECGVCGAKCGQRMNREVPSYACRGLQGGSRSHVCRSERALDAMVIRAVVGRVSDPEFLRNLAVRQDDTAATAAAREVADLRAKLAQLEESAVSPDGISAAAFARFEAVLLPQIEAAHRRAVPQRVHPAVLELAGPDAAKTWDRWGIETRRAAVRAMLRVVVHRVSSRRGSHGFDDSSVELIWR